MVPAHKPVNASLSAHAGKSGQLTDEGGAVNRLKVILAIDETRQCSVSSLDIRRCRPDKPILKTEQ